MKTITISFVTTCPECGKIETHRIAGLGPSHAEWITRMGKTGIYPDWHCEACKTVVSAALTDVNTEEAGKR